MDLFNDLHIAGLSGRGHRMPSFCIDCSGLGEAGMSRLHRNGLVVQWTCQAAADPV